MFYVQPQRGEQAQLLHLVVNVGVHVVQAGGGQVPLPGQVNYPQAHDVEHRAGDYHQPGEAEVQPLKAKQAGAENNQENGGQEEHQDDRKLGQDGGDNHVGVVAELVARRRFQGAGSVIGLEDGLGDHLRHIDNGYKHRQNLGHQAVGKSAPGQGESGQEKASRQTEHQIHRHIGQGHLHIDMEHQLQIEQQRRKQQYPGHGLDQHGVPAPAGTSPHPSAVISHWNRPPILQAVLPIYFTHLLLGSQGIFL